MPTLLPIDALSPAQRELWDRVRQLWHLSQGRDRAAIAAALHPQYVGWDMSAGSPHRKEAAIASVLGDAAELKAYALTPHSVQVYEHAMGVVHYSYEATVQPPTDGPRVVTGKWTEVYLRQNDEWLMVAVGGRPDPSPQGPATAEQTPFVWHELVTPDQERSGAFFGALFGWTRNAVDAGPFGTYTLFQKQGHDVAGMMNPTPQTPGTGAYWHPYIAVDDADAFARQAALLGGRVVVPPHEVPGVGRICAVSDPTGAVAHLMQPLKNRA